MPVDVLEVLEVPHLVPVKGSFPPLLGQIVIDAHVETQHYSQSTAGEIPAYVESIKWPFVVHSFPQ